MRGPLNGTKGLALLSAAGFTEDGSGFCLVSTACPHDQEEVPATTTIRVTGPNGDAPWQGTATYRAVAIQADPHSPGPLKDIVMESADARDVMAFAIAVRNDLIVSNGDHSALAEPDTFVADDTCIHNAFMGLQYDWELDRAPSETSIHLRSPVDNYGEAYVAWRDARAEALLAGPPATPGPR